jgi:hypothetical protein
MALSSADLTPPDRNPDRFAPVFVLAPARSFTSVVTMMVGQHPELFGLPELKLFLYPTIGELEASLPRHWIPRGISHRSPGLVRSVAQLKFGGQSVNELAMASEWLHARSHWPGALVMDELLASAAPREAVEKSPENVISDGALQRLSTAYPLARFLHLTRHPVTTQASIARHRDWMSFPRRDDDFANDIAAWLDVHLRILDLTTGLPEERILRVRAEDVLNHQATKLGEIAAWLGIRADGDAIEAMRHPERSPFARPGPAGSGFTGGQDPAFYVDPVPHEVELPSAIEPPAGGRPGLRLWRAAVDLAHHFGYQSSPGS